MAGLRLEAAPSRRWDFMAHYSALWLASATDSFSTTGVRDATGRSGDFAGHQFDGRARYWIVPQSLRLEGNMAWLGRGRFLERAPNVPRGGDTLYGSMAVIAQF